MSAGPVFYNQDFQAAKNYAEILRYVQAKNGTIMMNVPAVTYGIVRRENLKALCKNRYISSRKMTLHRLELQQNCTGTLIKYMA